MARNGVAASLENGPISYPPSQETALFTSSNGFTNHNSDVKPNAKRWDHHLSRESQARGGGKLKMAGNASTMISLGVGRPASQFFPWKAVMLYGVEARYCAKENATDSTTVMSCQNGESGYDLAAALNYGPAGGYPQVLRFFTDHVQLKHNPPYRDWKTSLTCGSTSALDITLRMLCDRGDWILAENYTYSGAIETAKPLGLNMQGVEMDSEGLLPDDLESKLRSWDSAKGAKPHVLYTIPSGHNPTGRAQSTERRKAIYQIAEKHDLLIIEDDPYYYMQLGDGVCRSDVEAGTSDVLNRYLKVLPTSYLALDKSGRVLRLDSTSKILAPGLRCGWMTGCSQLVQKFLNHTGASTISPSGPSQVMIYKLLSEDWGHDGFMEWLSHLSLRYRNRRDSLINSCKRHLPDICCWDVPTMGMFLWIQLDRSKHPSFHSGQYRRWEEVPLLDIENRIYEKAKENGVLVSKGSWFVCDAEQSQPIDLCFRMTFAEASLEIFDQAVKRFGDSVRAEFLLL
ncbi:Aromatic/aminoadipate aminotransferase 1 [Thelotrema lepadinum]|nr:Aromatic/aminoadipate aminotransferase 1 [Thelotrema lepadinum]